MKKPAIKALALTMAITMALSTPLTAKASLADLYRTMTANSGNAKDSDKPDYEDETEFGNYEDETESGNYEDETESGNYEDETESGDYEDETESGDYDDYEDDYSDKPGNGLDENYAARIAGLVLSEKNIEVDAEDTANLSAAILLQATSTTGKTVQVAVNAANANQYSNINILNVDGEESSKSDAEKALEMIEWTSANEGIAKVEKIVKPGTISVKGIGLVDGNGTTEITASLLGKSATANVKVISYSKEIKLTAPDPVYLKHAYNLLGAGENEKKYLNQISASGADYSANDAVTWELRATTVKNGKAAKAATYATISADGLMTAKKITAKSATDKQVKLEIRAVSERGVASNWAEVVILEGNPVKKISKITGDTKYDFGSKTSRLLTFEALYDTKYGGVTTDDFTWTSAKTNVAEVVVDSTDGAKCVIKVVGVGSTKITVKSTSGKSKSVTLKVTATILNSIDGVAPNSIVSGQSVKALTDPEGYTGKFKYELDKADSNYNTLKNQVTVKSNGAIVLKPAAVKDLPDGSTITVPVKVTPTDKNYKNDPKFNNVIFPVEVGKNPVVSIVINNAAELKGATIYTETDDLNTYKPNDKGEIEDKDKVDYKAIATLYKVAAKKATSSDIVTGLDDLISWKSSNTKVATIDPNGNITPVKSGSSTITASAVNSAGKVIKATVKIKVKTPATQIVINTPDVVKNPSAKNQTVTLKSSFPKGCGDKESVIWTKVEGDSGITIPSVSNKASVKVTIAKNTPVGSSAKFVVTATENGATATATVTVGAVVDKVKLTTAGTPNIVQPKANKDAYTVDMNRGEDLDLATVVSLVAKTESEQEYVGSPVYSLSGNKGNVILKNGKLYAVKEGKKIKLTIKAPAGKPSATLTITVNEPNESTN